MGRLHPISWVICARHQSSPEAFASLLFPLFRIVSHYNFLESQTIFIFNQNYREIIKIYSTEYIYYETIFNEESNDTYLVS